MITTVVVDGKVTLILDIDEARDLARSLSLAEWARYENDEAAIACLISALEVVNGRTVLPT